MEKDTQNRSEPSYGWKVRLHGRSLGQAREIVADALKDQGFGILTEIDVRETLRKKLGQEFRPYVILGACNPSLAYRALAEQPFVGLLLPCNVCLWEEGDGTAVSIARPAAMFQVVNETALQPIADEAERRLAAAFDKISRSSPS